MNKKSNLYPFLIIILLMSILSSCVSTGLNVINKLAKSGNFESFSNISYDDSQNKLDLYIPNNKISTATIVFFYGGCWGNCTRFKKQDYLFLADTLTQQGYAVVISDFRQYPQSRFDDIIQDATQATLWAIENSNDFGIESDNVFLMGHSSGAHIAAMLASNEKFLGESLNKIKGFIGMAGPYDFFPFSGDYMYDLFSPENNYFDALPINFINGNEPPHLLLHGLKDKTVFLHNTNNLAKKLQENGIETTKILLQNISHSRILVELSKPFRKKSIVLKNIVKFVEKHSIK